MVMMQISIHGKKSIEIIEIVKELRAMNWKQNIDFDFAFNQSKWDEMIGEIPMHTIFTFYNEKCATMFILRWASV
jgi:hypothetical protein